MTNSLAAKGMVRRMVVASRIAMTESLVAKGMAQCVVFIKIAVTEVWLLKDGAWNCNRAVTEYLAAKGGTLCARVGSKGIVECTSARKLQWVKFPGCYRARTDGY